MQMGLNTSSDDSALDLDSDGLKNFEEYQLGTAANKADTDNDGLSDKLEIDNNMDPTNGSDATVDTDKDGISDGKEVLAGTNPKISR